MYPSSVCYFFPDPPSETDFISIFRLGPQSCLVHHFPPSKSWILSAFTWTDPDYNFFQQLTWKVVSRDSEQLLLFLGGSLVVFRVISFLLSFPLSLLPSKNSPPPTTSFCRYTIPVLDSFPFPKSERSPFQFYATEATYSWRFPASLELLLSPNLLMLHPKMISLSSVFQSRQTARFYNPETGPQELLPLGFPALPDPSWPLPLCAHN